MVCHHKSFLFTFKFNNVILIILAPVCYLTQWKQNVDITFVEAALLSYQETQLANKPFCVACVKL